MASTPGSATTARSISRMVRLDRIEELLLNDEPVEPTIRAEFTREDGRPLGERQIKRDIAEVWHRIRQRYEAEVEVLHAKARAKWERRERLADKRGDTQAGNFALDRWTKLNGLYPAKKIEHSGTIGTIGVSVAVDIQIDAIIAVLTPAGRAALDLVLDEIDQARARGALPDPADPAEPDDAGEEDDGASRALPPGQAEAPAAAAAPEPPPPPRTRPKRRGRRPPS